MLFVDVLHAAVKQGAVGGHGDQVALAESVAGGRIVAHAVGLRHPGGVRVAVAAVMRFPRQVAVVLRHPALDSAPVAGQDGLHEDLPLAAQLVGAGAVVPGDEVRGGVQHFARVVQQHAGDRQRIGAGPGAEAVGVHGFEVLEGFGAGGAGGQERGEGEGAKVQFS